MNCAPATAHHHYKSRHNYTTAAGRVQGISPTLWPPLLAPPISLPLIRSRAYAHVRTRVNAARVARNFFFPWHVRSICLTWAGWNFLSCRVKRRDRDPTPFFFPPVISTLHNIAFYRPRSYIRTSVRMYSYDMEYFFGPRLSVRMQSRSFARLIFPRRAVRCKVNCLWIFPRGIIDSRCRYTRISMNAELSAVRSTILAS